MLARHPDKNQVPYSLKEGETQHWSRSQPKIQTQSKDVCHHPSFWYQVFAGTPHTQTHLPCALRKTSPSALIQLKDQELLIQQTVRARCSSWWYLHLKRQMVPTPQLFYTQYTTAAQEQENCSNKSHSERVKRKHTLGCSKDQIVPGKDWKDFSSLSVNCLVGPSGHPGSALQGNHPWLTHSMASDFSL